MICKNVLSPEAFSSAARQKFWLGNLQMFLTGWFALDTVRWLDRTASGAFWRHPLVHGFAVAVLLFYSLLAARGITRITRRVVSSSDSN